MTLTTSLTEKSPTVVKSIRNKNITAGLPGYSKGSETKIVLPALLVIVLYQYMGIPQYMPALKGLNLDFFLSLTVLIWLIMHGGLKRLFSHKQTKIFIYFIVIGCFSIFYALMGTKVLTVLTVYMGNFILFCICYSVFQNVRRVDIFITFFVAMHALLVIMNINELLIAGRGGHIRAGYFLGDWNDFGWSLTIVLPFAIYLFLKAGSMLAKFVSLGSAVTIVSGIILSQSRGAAIATAASVVFFALTSKRRVFALTVSICAILIVLAFAPGSYLQRLETIRSYDSDSSSRGRLMAWRAAVAMAMDHPLGVGPGNFPNVYGRFYRGKYSDPTVWSPNRWIAVHSIYFLVLAEYGFFGLVLLLLLLYWNFKSNLRIGHVEKVNTAQTSARLKLPRMLNASLTAFATGGVFLGGFIYPHIYILTSMTMALNVLANRDSSPGM